VGPDMGNETQGGQYFMPCLDYFGAPREFAVEDAK
jgi:hypothetical protein